MRSDLPSIGMVTMGFGPRYPGGAEHQASLLSHELAKRGRRVLIYTPSASYDGSGSSARRLVRVVPVPCLSLPRTRTATFLPMLGLVTVFPGFEHPAILHTHMAWYQAAVPEAAKRLRPIRTVVKFACSGVDGDIAHMSRGRLGRTTLAAIVKADRIVALTDAVAAELRDIGVPSDRIRRIPNGVSIEPRPPAARDVDGIGGPKVLFAGRLTVQKGILPFLEAWASVVRRLPTATLLVAGTGALARAIRARADAPDLRGRVVMLGHRTDVPALMAAVDAVVLPSRSEGMSNVALEAMAAGRAFFGFAIPGVEEVVADPRALAPGLDFAALADRLTAALKSPDLLAELAECGNERVRTHFAIGRVASMYEEVYDELAG